MINEIHDLFYKLKYRLHELSASDQERLRDALAEAWDELQPSESCEPGDPLAFAQECNPDFRSWGQGVS